MSILLQKKNVGDYSYMSSPNIYYRASFYTPIIHTKYCKDALCSSSRQEKALHRASLYCFISIFFFIEIYNPIHIWNIRLFKYNAVVPVLKSYRRFHTE